MMSNLENITQKILDEARAQVSELKQESQAIRDAITQESLSKAEALRNHILEKAASDVEQLKERRLSGASLKARDKTLDAKQKVMDRVIDLAKQRLSALSDEEYLQFLKKTIEAVRPAEDMELMVEKERVQAVQNLGLPYPICEQEFATSGFLLRNEAMTLNFSFPDLVDDVRQEVEAGILSSLFEKGE